MAASLLVLPRAGAAQDEAPAPPPEERRELEFVPPPQPKIVVRGCPDAPRLEQGTLVYVGCEGMVFVLERGAGDAVVERKRRAVGGEVIGFFERRGEVWVEVRSAGGASRATPVSLSSDETAPLPEADASFVPSPEPARPMEAPDPQRFSQRVVAPRTPGTSFSARVAPFLGDGEGGVMLGAGVSYRARVPFTLHASLDPFAYGANPDASFRTYALRVDASFDMDFFEIGIGTGAQRVREETVSGMGEIGIDSRHRASMGFRARFGALDGVHLATRLRWVYFDDFPQFSDAFVEFSMPAWKGGWITTGGGGGEILGIWLANVGLRTSVFGRHQRDDLILTLLVGWAQMRNQIWWEDTAQGFQATFGLEYRLPSKRRG